MSGGVAANISAQGTIIRSAADPWGVVNVVIGDLARRGIKSKFGDLREAVQYAADLLEALDVAAVIPGDDPPNSATSGGSYPAVGES